MERLFRTHYIRKQECLDGTWEFQTVEEYELPKEYTDRMAVPACWEMSMQYTVTPVALHTEEASILSVTAISGWCSRA